MLPSKAFAFQIFGFSVRVDFSFFLMTAILGSSGTDLMLLFIWIAVVFVSVLAHEFGHAAMGKHYGLQPRIELYSGGGLTWWDHPAWGNSFASRPLSHFQNIAISLAGPIVGFIIGIAALLMTRTVPIYTFSPYMRVVVLDVIWVNIGWGILNLLPILPMDGGNVMRSIVQYLRRNDDETLPLKISIGVGIAIGILAFMSDMIWGAILCGWFTYNNYQQLRGNRGY